MRRALLAASLAWTLAACGNGNGGHCETDMECLTGLACLPNGVGDTHLCMRRCDYVDPDSSMEQHLCADGTVCRSMNGVRICYLGGTHELDTACTDDLDCEAGGVCATDTLVCTQACTVGVDIPCSGSETCVAISGGICRAPLVVVVDAGVDGGP